MVKIPRIKYRDYVLDQTPFMVIFNRISMARQRSHSCLYPSRIKVVVDLVTVEGCKAELT